MPRDSGAFECWRWPMISGQDIQWGDPWLRPRNQATSSHTSIAANTDWWQAVQYDVAAWLTGGLGGGS